MHIIVEHKKVITLFIMQNICQLPFIVLLQGMLVLKPWLLGYKYMTSHKG